ncbi:MAG: hypothetical protein UV89_C0011G0022 [candidate division WWE3 bacterium GW2011_GWB2_43_22]|uniref:Thioredoxin domain-containing protein n=1 Tax=candidate division WWE3 bacterium GW2011_GWB2_43_22 TaxID=1619118 RepID=A0A0G1EP07_UNCKA|nr:MAG: hypothetical protein UV89_C0011G0022 [candidate division WWE3 bacterium GW2011_GWB2_43_22]
MPLNNFMKEKRVLIIGSIITIALLTVPTFLLNGNNGQSSPKGQSENGETTTLSSLKGKNVVLFFNEGLMCYPACWDQIAAFGKDTEFTAKNTVVLTIVTDPKKDWKGAVEKMPDLAKATVLLDTNRKVSVAYKMLSLPSSMHRGQTPGHTYVVIDKEGIVRYVRDDVQMAIRNQELLGEIGKL